MIKDKVSIVIPDRNGQPYLQQTIDDLIAKAEGEIEIIVAADGIWPDPPLKEQKPVTLLHHGTPHNNLGMRASINRAIALSNGEYIMKIDEHCTVGQGFDRILKEDCGEKDVVIPRRKRWDAENWVMIEDGRPDIDYMYLEYPFLKEFDKTQGLHGAEWKRPERAIVQIDDTPTMQGSCYFVRRAWWDTIIPLGLDDTRYGTFTQEAQEISMASWLFGGSVKVNKKTYYAHFHKGKRGKGYGFSNEQYRRHMEGNERGRLFCINYWINNGHFSDPIFSHIRTKQPFSWLINEKFPTMPGWDGDWQTRLEKDKNKDYSNLPPEQRPDWFENNTK
jgi:glycosyltransferase involved in cell wall biosynthesis